MGWMDLNDYLLIAEAAGSRADDLRRATGQQPLDSAVTLASARSDAGSEPCAWRRHLCRWVAVASS